MDRKKALLALMAAGVFDPSGSGEYDPTQYGTVIESWDFLRSDALFQDSGATTPAGIGDPVGAYVSPFTSVAWTQTATANKPARQADGVAFDGTDDVLRCTSDAITSTAGSYTLIARYTDDVGTDDTLRYLVDVETGRQIWASSFDANNTIAYYDGAWREYAVAGQTGIQTLTFIKNAGVNTTLRRDGLGLATVAAGPAVNIGGVIAIGARYTSGNAFSGIINRVTLYAGVLSGQNLIDAETAIAS